MAKTNFKNLDKLEKFYTIVRIVMAIISCVLLVLIIVFWKINLPHVSTGCIYAWLVAMGLGNYANGFLIGQQYEKAQTIKRKGKDKDK